MLSKKLKSALQNFLEEIREPLLEDENTCASAMTILTILNEKLLVLAASHGGVKSNPEFTLKEKMVYMGNQSVAEAFKSCEEDGIFDMLELFEALKGGGE